MVYLAKHSFLGRSMKYETVEKIDVSCFQFYSSFKSP